MTTTSTKSELILSEKWLYVHIRPNNRKIEQVNGGETSVSWETVMTITGYFIGIPLGLYLAKVPPFGQ